MTVSMVFLIKKGNVMRGSPAAQYVTAQPMAVGGEASGNFGAHD
jgi:hypothetical protein